MTAPVKVTNNHFENVLNCWREWSWSGPEPLNKRIQAFVSIVELNDIYNVSYAGIIPFTMVHRIQHRTMEGEANKWLVFKYVYGYPFAI